MGKLQLINVRYRVWLAPLELSHNLKKYVKMSRLQVDARKRKEENEITESCLRM